MGYSIFWNDLAPEGSAEADGFEVNEVTMSGVGNSFETVTAATAALEEMANLLNQIGFTVLYEADGKQWDGDDLGKVYDYWRESGVGSQFSARPDGGDWRTFWVDSDDARIVQESAHLFKTRHFRHNG
jgi:hypothetical protein